MLTLERSTDWKTIKFIMTHPKVFPHVSDDFTPAPDIWEPIQHDSIWYVLVKDGEELLGMWCFAPENRVCWKVHTCLLPNAYGIRAAEASQMMAQWIWEHTECLRIVTDVPEYNRLALRFAKASGMTEFGRNPDSWMKNGKLHCQILLGMTKPGAHTCP